MIYHGYLGNLEYTHIYIYGFKVLYDCKYLCGYLSR